MTYHHRHGQITDATGRVIDFDDAEALVRIWFEAGQDDRSVHRNERANLYFRDALSLGEAWIAARGWRRWQDEFHGREIRA